MFQSGSPAQGVVRLRLQTNSPSSSIGNSLAKRLEDLLLGVTVLLLLSPLMIMIAIVIRCDSSGPVFFRQRRRGLHGEIFTMWKFRTMYHAMSDQDCRQQSINGDRRITRVGAYLRRFSLDELPQIFNVLGGSMSLVGPRPHALGTSISGKLLHEISPDYPWRYTVKPGITGLAQINGCRGILDSEEKLESRLYFDFQYINDWSLYTDMRILWKTATCVWRDRTAF